MKENPVSILGIDVVDMPRTRKDFSGNITDLYNAMIQFNPNGASVSLGKLHEFELTYDGVILSVGSLEMDENSAKALRDYVLGENVTGDVFGNPLGTPQQIVITDEASLDKMWSVPIEFINWPNHFGNTPSVVLDSLEQLAKHLHAYRKKMAGFEDSEDDGFRTEKGNTERIRMHFSFGDTPKEDMNSFTEEDGEGEEDISLPDKTLPS